MLPERRSVSFLFHSSEVLSPASESCTGWAEQRGQYLDNNYYTAAMGCPERVGRERDEAAKSASGGLVLSSPSRQIKSRLCSLDQMPRSSAIATNFLSKGKEDYHFGVCHRHLAYYDI